MNRWRLLGVVFIMCCTLRLSAAVIGIDFGSNWIKMAVIRDNGFNIVLDSASQRKVSNAVSFGDDDRYFGPDAERLVSALAFIVSRILMIHSAHTGCEKSGISLCLYCSIAWQTVWSSPCS